ncbi:MAG: YqgE/AlgH family protein [Acidobacteriota bacterium]
MSCEIRLEAPCLLVAMPSLQDPNFSRTVILLTSHGDDGSLGFIVNRTLDASVHQVLEGLGIHWQGDPDTPVWNGGPVTPQSGWVLFGGDAEEAELLGAEELVPGLHLSSSLDALRALADAPGPDFRLLLGYAGWGAQQLDGEVLRGDWLVMPVERGVFLGQPPESVWPMAYRVMGLHPGVIVPDCGVHA